MEVHFGTQLIKNNVYNRIKIMCMDTHTHKHA